MSKRNRAADRAARAAALRAEQERKERQRRWLTIGGVVLVLALIVGVGFWLQSRANTTDENAATPANATDGYCMRLGDEGTHEVVVYEDFLCPACKAFEDSMNDELTSAVEEGRATVEYRPLNFLDRFGDYSERAANAWAVVLDSSGPEVAKKFHDLIYAQQPSESGPYPDDSWLVEQAVAAGADKADVEGGIDDLAFKSWVKNGVVQATKDGVQATPTVLVDGEHLDDWSKLPDALK